MLKNALETIPSKHTPFRQKKLQKRKTTQKLSQKNDSTVVSHFENVFEQN